MKLFFSPGACALASQIALREAGTKFDLVKVDLKNKTYEGGDYKKINPKGYVPAMQMDDGQILTEGAVMLQWIADHSPEKNLLPKLGTMERYRSMEWLHFVATEVHKGFSPLFNPTVQGDVRQGFVDRLQLRFAFLDQHLKQNQFILGAEFSVVDAYLYNVVRWAKGTKVDISQHHSLLGFMERMSSRPSVRAAVEAEGLTL